MKAISKEKRLQYSEILKDKAQNEVMKEIEQFAEARIHNGSETGISTSKLGVLVFNMERGVHLKEIMEFLEYNDRLGPFDIILANELDDGCLRSGNQDVAKEFADHFNLNYVYGLEFIELAEERDEKGFHGNAVFSRWPIIEAKIVRLPEQYNWFFDRQTRIGGRNAVFAKVNIDGREVGFASIHLENRASAGGRREQMKAVYEEARTFFKDIPVILGGDLNTNTFDGRKTEDIWEVALSPESENRCMNEVARYEKLLEDAKDYGYSCFPEDNRHTRRKPLPNGEYLPLRLDWLMVKDVKVSESRTVSTQTRDFDFIRRDMKLYEFDKPELSDHNAIWACVILD